MAIERRGFLFLCACNYMANNFLKRPLVRIYSHYCRSVFEVESFFRSLKQITRQGDFLLRVKRHWTVRNNVKRFHNYLQQSEYIM